MSSMFIASAAVASDPVTQAWIEFVGAKTLRTGGAGTVAVVGDSISWSAASELRSRLQDDGWAALLHAQPETAQRRGIRARRVGEAHGVELEVAHHSLTLP